MWNIVTLAGIAITALTVPPVLLQMRNHPKGIHILFFTEMWERFSYYGMRGILVAYMTQHFLFDDTIAQGQYGAYTSLVYLLPLIGGFLADKYLGTRKAIAFGALLLVAGHLAMAIEQAPVRQTLTYQGQTYRIRRRRPPGSAPDVARGRGAALRIWPGRRRRHRHPRSAGGFGAAERVAAGLV